MALLPLERIPSGIRTMTPRSWFTMNRAESWMPSCGLVKEKRPETDSNIEVLANRAAAAQRTALI
jgi:hypothetical protein